MIGQPARCLHICTGASDPPAAATPPALQLRLTTVLSTSTQPHSPRTRAASEATTSTTGRMQRAVSRSLFPAPPAQATLPALFATRLLPAPSHSYKTPPPSRTFGSFSVILPSAEHQPCSSAVRPLASHRFHRASRSTMSTHPRLDTSLL